MMAHRWFSSKVLFWLLWTKSSKFSESIVSRRHSADLIIFTMWNEPDSNPLFLCTTNRLPLHTSQDCRSPETHCLLFFLFFVVLFFFLRGFFYFFYFHILTFFVFSKAVLNRFRNATWLSHSKETRHVFCAVRAHSHSWVSLIRPRLLQDSQNDIVDQYVGQSLKTNYQKGAKTVAVGLVTQYNSQFFSLQLSNEVDKFESEWNVEITVG